MSSRSLAAARARRAGENAPPVSGNRPVTSIGSHAAFAPSPPHPNNVRTARAMQSPPQNQQQQQQPITQHYQYYDQSPQQQTSNGLPFQKLSISDAIGLITLRLGRVEQWIIETDHEEGLKQSGDGDMSGIPENHRVIDNSVLTSMINRIDSLEKNGLSGSGSGSSEEIKKLSEDLKTLTEQFKRLGDDVSKHTIELAKNTEQVFRFNRELTETKDILKSFMVKYDMFAQETTQNFSDYENALSDLEKRLPVIPEAEEKEGEEEEQEASTNINDIDAETNNIIMSVDLKNMIKQELGNI